MVEPAELRYHFSIPHQWKIQDFLSTSVCQFRIWAYRVSSHKVNIQGSIARCYNVWVY